MPVLCWVGADDSSRVIDLCCCLVVLPPEIDNRQTDTGAKAESRMDKSEEKGRKQTEINFIFSPFCFLALL